MHDDTIYLKIVARDFRKTLKAGDKVKVGAYCSYDYWNENEIKNLIRQGWDLSSNLRELKEIYIKEVDFKSIKSEKHISWSYKSKVYPPDMSNAEIARIDPAAEIYYKFMGLI